MTATEFLTPELTGVLTPTPGYLADILHVELSTGNRVDTTYGTDTYGSWDYGGKQEWVRWDCDITSLSLFRGRQTRLERNSPGVCYFNAVQIVPASWMTTPPTARPARIITADDRVVFYGVIETAVLTREYGTAEWSVTIVDDLARLGRLEVGTLVRPVEDVGVRVDALLAAAGMFTYGLKADLYVQAVNGSGRKVLDEMGIAIDTWKWSYGLCGVAGSSFGGAALIDRTGAFSPALATFPPDGGNPNLYDYPWRISPTPAGHAHNTKRWLGDALHVEFAADLADLRNYLTFSHAGGTAVVTQDVPSVAAYGPRSYQRMDFIGANGPTYPASVGLDSWAYRAMNPTPTMRFKTISVDCWNRPAGAVPLIDLLGNLDVSHVVEVLLPDQDDAGGDIANTPPPMTDFITSGSFIYGLSWDLTDRSAILTVTLDCAIRII